MERVKQIICDCGKPFVSAKTIRDDIETEMINCPDCDIWGFTYKQLKKHRTLVKMHRNALKAKSVENTLHC